jgi:hypothetical protein
VCGLQKDPLAVKVNQLSSIKTQLPYSYYSLPFCRPGTIVDSAENLGEVLRGDRIENSLYVVSAVSLRASTSAPHVQKKYSAPHPLPVLYMLVPTYLQF